MRKLDFESEFTLPETGTIHAKIRVTESKTDNHIQECTEFNPGHQEEIESLPSLDGHHIDKEQEKDATNSLLPVSKLDILKSDFCKLKAKNLGKCSSPYKPVKERKFIKTGFSTTHYTAPANLHVSFKEL